MRTKPNQDAAAGVRASAARALGAVTSSARIAVPALAKALADADCGVRLAAISSLVGFGPEASPAFSSLQEVRSDTDLQVRREADRALKLIGRAGGERQEDGQ